MNFIDISSFSSSLFLTNSPSLFHTACSDLFSSLSSVVPGLRSGTFIPGRFSCFALLSGSHRNWILSFTPSSLILEAFSSTEVVERSPNPCSQSISIKSFNLARSQKSSKMPANSEEMLRLLFAILKQKDLKDVSLNSPSHLCLCSLKSLASTFPCHSNSNSSSCPTPFSKPPLTLLG